MVLAIVMMFTFSGCASYEASDTAKTTKTVDSTETTDASDTSDSTITTKTTDLTESKQKTIDARTMAEDLISELENAYQKGDKVAFTKCFYKENQSCADALWKMFDEKNPTRYENKKVTFVAHQNDLYSLSIVDYTVDGFFPNTHTETNSYCLVVRNINGKFVVDESQENEDIMNKKILSENYIFPKEFIQAYFAGRNVVLTDEYNYLFLNDHPVYEGSSQTVVKYVWQEEDGRVGIGILIQNGSDHDIYYGGGTITLTDSYLGEIGTWNIVVDETVSAGECRRYEFVFDEHDVNTGTQAWNQVRTDCDLDFK